MMLARIAAAARGQGSSRPAASLAGRPGGAGVPARAGPPPSASATATFKLWALLVHGGTSVALGALSIGHEYSHRTLPLLLSQPASRARVFVVKQVVLAMMLLSLALVAWINVVVPLERHGDGSSCWWSWAGCSSRRG